MIPTIQTTRRTRRSNGQAIVLLVLALVAMLAMAGLVVDGGNLFAQQRRTQNWTDASANAGAVQLLRRLIGVPGSEAEWDQRVIDAVNESVAGDGLESVVSIEYTDIDGNVLVPAPGTGDIPDDAAGVRVVGERSVGTYLAGIVGLSSFTATADATAVAGYANGSAAGNLIPVTFPVRFTQCDGNDLVVNGSWPVGPSNPVVIPMCSNGPGNVGWIDWTPSNPGFPPCESSGTGTNELACSIENPNNPPMQTPHWYYITNTGAVSSSQVQTALEGYIGVDVNIPIFYADETDPLPGTCNSTPLNDQDDIADCPIGDRGGTGSNQWYFLVELGNFHLQEVHVQGSSSSCDAGEVSGGNISGCLIGYWTEDVAPANLTIGTGGSTPTSNLSKPTVQLID
jgi:hypothetical protein